VGPSDTARLVRRCRRRDCINPTHLATDGRRLRHVRTRGGRLDPWKVAEMRAAAAAGVPQDVLAVRYGVTQGTVSRAVRGKTWRRVRA
jgi:hypothetical protein